MSRRFGAVAVVVVALMALGACSSSGPSGGANPPLTTGVPEATLPPPPNSLPAGISQVCESSVYSVVGKIVGPFKGSVPSTEYKGTTFAVLLSASLNNCATHDEWLRAAVLSAHGYQAPLDLVFKTACASVATIPATGGSGSGGGSGGNFAPLPRSCRSLPATTVPTSTAPAPAPAP